MEVLFDTIQKDLESLYNHDYILQAKELNNSIGNAFFSEKKPPMYFTGKLEAETVFIMLNPGSYNDECYSFARSHKYKFESSISYYNQYIYEHKNFGKIDYSRKDNFDLKQASFLYHFKNSGLNLPDFLSDLKNPKLLLDAKEEVLMNKLQLELIPYCSVNFDNLIDNKKHALSVIDVFIPHISRILDVIIAHERKFVIFGAQKFAHLFEAYEIKRPGSIVLGKHQTAKIKDLQKQVGWQTITIKHNSKIIKGIIPYSFPRRDLPNAHQKMAEYGKLCFESYSNEYGLQ
jgi:hypothetical protein